MTAAHFTPISFTAASFTAAMSTRIAETFAEATDLNAACWSNLDGQDACWPVDSGRPTRAANPVPDQLKATPVTRPEVRRHPEFPEVHELALFRAGRDGRQVFTFGADEAGLLELACSAWNAGEQRTLHTWVSNADSSRERQRRLMTLCLPGETTAVRAWRCEKSECLRMDCYGRRISDTHAPWRFISRCRLPLKELPALHVAAETLYTIHQATLLAGREA